MRFEKTLFKLVSLIVILLGSVLFLSNRDKVGQQTVLRVGHTLDIEHSVHHSLTFMKKRLSHYSKGTMSLKIFPNGLLGSEREMVELLQIGSLAMTKVSAATMEGFVPEMKVYSLPYLFRNREHRWKVLQSEVGLQVLKAVERSHLKGLGYFDAGSRSFYSCRNIISTPADVEGKKIRVMNSQTAVKMIEMFGGAATPIAWGELYTALQQGVVDGAENNPPSYYASRHYEICPYYSLNEHTSIPDVIIASQHIFSKLNSQQQHWLKQAMNDATEYQKSLWEEAEKTALLKIKQFGVKVVYPDKTPFFNAVVPLHNSYNDTIIGPYLMKIKQVSQPELANNH